MEANPEAMPVAVRVLLEMKLSSLGGSFIFWGLKVISEGLLLASVFLFIVAIKELS